LFLGNFSYCDSVTASELILESGGAASTG
jgi:hypothetical protein